MLTEEIIQRVISLYSKGVQTDDVRLKPYHVYSKFVSARNLLLNRRLRKRNAISKWNYQSLDCVELIRVPRSKCPCKVPDGCTVLRTKHKIPISLTVDSFNNHRIVSTVEGSTIFQELDAKRIKHMSNNKYANKIEGFLLQDNYYYIITDKKMLSVISITDVFADPMSIFSFPSSCYQDEECQECISPLEIDFPIDEDLVDTLVEMAANELILYFRGMTNDIRSNTKDDIVDEPATEGQDRN